MFLRGGSEEFYHFSWWWKLYLNVYLNIFYYILIRFLTRTNKVSCMCSEVINAKDFSEVYLNQHLVNVFS